MPGLITRLLEVKAETPAPDDDYWYGPVVSASHSGIEVNPDNALKISTVYACVKVLAESVAQLPLIIYQRQADGGKNRATNHPLYSVLHDQPNVRQTSFDWREMMMGHLLLRGNAYSQIVPGPRGFADQLVPLNPDRMKVELLPTGIPQYIFREKSGGSRIFRDEEIFHLRGFSSDGITGMSVITLAREGLGLALAAEGYGARFFSQNAQPGGILEHPGKLTDEGAKRISDSWKKAHTGMAGAHQVALLEEGMTWHQMGMTSEDAQFLQTREHQVEDIARWFRVPLHMIGSTSKVTSWGTGIEQLSLGFVIYSLMPWLKRWEQTITRDLIIATQAYFAEFLVDALLRGDQASRYAAYATARNWGWLSVNDIRTLENLNPIEGGDTYLQPMTHTIVEPAANVDQVRLLARGAAGRVVRKEIAAMTRAGRRFAADSVGWQEAVQKFYQEHRQYLIDTLHLTEAAAEEYAWDQRDSLLYAGPQAMVTWEQERTDWLVEHMMEEKG